MSGTTPMIGLRSVGYALLTQTVWLPLLGFDAWDTSQDRALKQATRDQRAEQARSVAGPPGLPWQPRGSARDTGTLLNGPLAIARSGADPLMAPPISSIDERPSARSSDPVFRPYRPSSGSATAPVARLSADPIARAYSRAELLGGSLGLDGLRSPLMPPLALAEQARLRGSGDPFLPLPLSLRSPMRQAIQQLPSKPSTVQQARVMNVPSARVKAPIQVPVALQSDGSVDILATINRSAADDVRDWSRQQPSPPRGSVTPAVINLHPLPQAEQPVAPRPEPAAVRSSALPPPVTSHAQPPQAPPPVWTPVATTAMAEPAPAPAPEPVSAATPEQVLP